VVNSLFLAEVDVPQFPGALRSYAARHRRFRLPEGGTVKLHLREV